MEAGTQVEAGVQVGYPVQVEAGAQVGRVSCPGGGWCSGRRGSYPGEGWHSDVARGVFLQCGDLVSGPSGVLVDAGTEESLRNLGRS